MAEFGAATLCGTLYPFVGPYVMLRCSVPTCPIINADNPPEIAALVNLVNKAIDADDKEVG